MEIRKSLPGWLRFIVFIGQRLLGLLWLAMTRIVFFFGLAFRGLQHDISKQNQSLHIDIDF
jgi:hypothetical protein